MKQYLEALEHIMAYGEDVDDRTGVGTRSVFGYQMRFDLSKGFPATTTKKLAWKAVVSELLWFLEGSTNERRLAEILHGTTDPSKKTIWTANYEKQGKDLGYDNGYLGPIYGKQWRSWETKSSKIGIDQIAKVIESIKNDPDSRRHIVSAWNPAQIDNMTLPPCHTMFQFKVTNGKLSCQLYQRSADMFLGVPFNIASYSLLIHMIAQICDLEVGEFIWTGGDCHIYQNHFDAVYEQLEREPDILPILQMPKFKTLDGLLDTKVDMYDLLSYNPMPSIKAPMAV
jgi:thymidylate synthase